MITEEKIASLFMATQKNMTESQIAAVLAYAEIRFPDTHQVIKTFIKEGETRAAEIMPPQLLLAYLQRVYECDLKKSAGRDVTKDFFEDFKKYLLAIRPQIVERKIREVFQNYKKANLKEIGQKIAEIEQIFELDADEIRADVSFESAINDIFFRHTSETRIVPTPWPQMNAILETGGLEGGQMSVFMGLPGQGKSSIATQIALHAAKNKKDVLFISAEMPWQQVYLRMMSQILEQPTPVLISKIVKGELNANLFQNFEQFLMVINPTSGNAKETEMWIEKYREKRKRLPLLVIYDYVQLASMGLPGKTEDLSETASYFSKLAIQYNIHTLLLSQTTQGIDGAMHTMYARAIEHPATLVCVISNQNAARKTLLVKKNRFGPSQIMFDFAWNPLCMLLKQDNYTRAKTWSANQNYDGNAAF